MAFTTANSDKREGMFSMSQSFAVLNIAAISIIAIIIII